MQLLEAEKCIIAHSVYLSLSQHKRIRARTQEQVYKTGRSGREQKSWAKLPWWIKFQPFNAINLNLIIFKQFPADINAIGTGNVFD